MNERYDHEIVAPYSGRIGHRKISINRVGVVVMRTFCSLSIYRLGPRYHDGRNAADAGSGGTFTTVFPLLHSSVTDEGSSAGADEGISTGADEGNPLSDPIIVCDVCAANI